MSERVEPMNVISPRVAARPAVSRVPASEETVPATNHQVAREVYQTIAHNIARIMRRQAGSTRKLLAAMASGGPELPVEFRGTYPLPEAQMDRFAMQFALGYVESGEEVAILTAQEHQHPLEWLKACVSLREVLELKRGAQEVRISEELKRYAVDLVGA